jgi:hypothetical protein
MVSVRRGRQILAKSRQNLSKIPAKYPENIGKISAKTILPGRIAGACPPPKKKDFVVM